MKFLNADVQFVCYAPIDLKLADIFVYDGWDEAGVTNTALEPITETVIALTACNELVPVGCRVTFGNDTTLTEYSVGSRATSGGTAAIFTFTVNADTGNFRLTFDGDETTDLDVGCDLIDLENALHALDSMENGTVDVTGVPGTNYIVTWQTNEEIVATRFTLSQMPTGLEGNATWALTTPGSADTSTDTITLTEGLAMAIGAGGTVDFRGVRLEVKVGEGNVVWTETLNRDYILDRGNLDTVRNGDQAPVDVKFEFTWEWITAVTGSGVPTLEDALKNRGEASTWVTTDSDVCAPYCVDIIIWYDPGCGGSNTEKIELPYFRYESLDHNISDSQISCAGKCNVVEATATRI